MAIVFTSSVCPKAILMTTTTSPGSTELANKAIASISVLGALQASAAVKAELADRIS